MRSDPLILAFDTSAAHCAAALLSGDRVLAGRVEDMSRGQAERLMPLLEEVLAEAGVDWRDLSAIGVGVGPGNFTGIRISVAAARGLALALSIPAVGVDGFEARGFGVPRPFACLIPGTRDTVYRQDMTEAGASDPVIQSLTDARAALENRGRAVAPEVSASEIVANIARIAAHRHQGPVPRPAPLYIRPADAAPPRDPAPVILP